MIELKVWELPVSEKYPNGIKYSLFCVNVEDSRVVVGFDNHHPKGHHLHIDDEEQHYFYVDEEKLIDLKYLCTTRQNMICILSLKGCLNLARELER